MDVLLTCVGLVGGVVIAILGTLLVYPGMPLWLRNLLDEQIQTGIECPNCHVTGNSSLDIVCRADNDGSYLPQVRNTTKEPQIFFSPQTIVFVLCTLGTMVLPFVVLFHEIRLLYALAIVPIYLYGMVLLIHFLTLLFRNHSPLLKYIVSFSLPIFSIVLFGHFTGSLPFPFAGFMNLSGFTLIWVTGSVFCFLYADEVSSRHFDREHLSEWALLAGLAFATIGILGTQVIAIYFGAVQVNVVLGAIRELFTESVMIGLLGLAIYENFLEPIAKDLILGIYT